MARSKEMDMLNGPLGMKILRFAIPLAATGILQQLFNAADVAVVGQFAGTTAMAAVGSNSPIIGLMVNLFVGVSLGTNVVIARFIGQENKEGVKHAVHTSILVALICGVAIAILGELFAPRLLHLLGVPEDVLPYSTLYLRIYAAGMPVILLYNFESAIFRSQGDTRTPLICLTVSGIINVLLNLFFVVGLHMSVDGVAIATVTSNLVSSAMLFYFLRKHTGLIHVDMKSFKIDFKVLRQILQIGLPAGLQGMVFALSNLSVQSAINSLGSTVMAASSAAFNVEIFLYYLLNSFGQACTTFVGQNYGAGKLDRCITATRLAVIMDIVVTLIGSALILTFSAKILSIFNADPAVIANGQIRLKYIVGGEILNTFMEVFSGALRGYGESLKPAVMTFIGVVGIRVSWIFFVFPKYPTFETIMIVYPLSWGVTAIAIVAVYIWYKNKYIKPELNV